MPELPSPEVKALIEAIDTFGGSNPRDLPDGLLDELKNVGQKLRGYGGDEIYSPGERDVASKQGASSDVAVDISKAATGHDSPSPGQREFAQRARELADLAGSLDSSK